jgi:hypothetical protein
MPDSPNHESQDLSDSEVLDANDTLIGDPGDDPLDRGVAAPDRWSAGVRYALRGEEDSESLDERLSEEEPDVTVDDTDGSRDENAPERDAERLERDYEPDPRAGRLVSTDGDGDDVTGTLVDSEADAVARDAGIDGGAATAEEAAVHVIDEDDAQA